MDSETIAHFMRTWIIRGPKMFGFAHVGHDACINRCILKMPYFRRDFHDSPNMSVSRLFILKIQKSMRALLRSGN
jgi:hypothetical protein